MTPWRRDAAAVQAGLAEWAAAWRGAGTRVSGVKMPESGMANDTVMFHMDGDALVARLAPAPGSPYPIFPTYDLERQQRVIELVRARTDVPVPEVVHFERSAEWLGAPFLVTRVVEGVVASDNPPYLVDPNGWFLQGTPEQWDRFEASTIDVLARLHRIAGDEATAFLQCRAPGRTALARQLAELRDFYEWGREGMTIPVLERAIELLTATLPDNDRCVLNWGDSRPGNIIYRDFTPAAVLDWEMAGVGPPELDVAWATFFQRFWAGMAAQYGITVPAMFDRAATAAAYERLTGTSLDDLAWYEALSGLRLGIIMARITMRGAAFGLLELPADPDDMIMFLPLLEQLLAEL